MKNKNFFKLNIIYFTAITLVATLFLLGYIGVIKNEILSSVLIQVVVMLAIPMLMYCLLLKRKPKETLKDCGIKKISAKMVAISILLGVVLYFINSFVADAFYSIISMFGYKSLSSGTTVKLTYGKLFKELILSCVLPGVCEEFLHRGLMLHANKKYANTKFCLITSSILFGLMHLNIRQFFYAAILGLLIGYVSLVADSIIPAIIIHFMNNFLSNYFFYGTQLNWPLAKFVNYVTNIFMENAFIFVGSSVTAIFLLLMLYNYLTRIILKERANNDIKAIMKALEMQKLSLIEAQIQINQINQLLKDKHTQEITQKQTGFSDKIFLISSFILGALITISSFIWGVI